MTVIRSRVLGLCEGARRSLRLVEQSEKDTDLDVVTWGNVLHNSHVIERLEKRGVYAISSLEEARRRRVVIRAHGIPLETEKELLEQADSVVNASCGFVLRSQKAAEKYAKAGYEVVIVGQKKHPEIIGVASRAPGAKIVETLAQAEALELSAPCVVLFQTTMERSLCERIFEELQRRCPSVEKGNFICRATEERQQALKELLGQVDLVIIVGDPQSENCRSLLSCAQNGGKEACLVSDAAALPLEMLGKVTTVGLSAGASTPDGLIDEIEKKIKEL